MASVDQWSAPTMSVFFFWKLMKSSLLKDTDISDKSLLKAADEVKRRRCSSNMWWNTICASLQTTNVKNVSLTHVYKPLKGKHDTFYVVLLCFQCSTYLKSLCACSIEREQVLIPVYPVAAAVPTHYRSVWQVVYWIKVMKKLLSLLNHWSVRSFITLWLLCSEAACVVVHYGLVALCDWSSWCVNLSLKVCLTVKLLFKAHLKPFVLLIDGSLFWVH